MQRYRTKHANATRVSGAPEDVVAAAGEVEEGRVLLEPLGGMLDDVVGVAHVTCEGARGFLPNISSEAQARLM